MLNFGDYTGNAVSTWYDRKQENDEKTERNQEKKIIKKQSLKEELMRNKL